MHVLVTGATGWVGSAVVPALVAAGHRVTGLVRSAERAPSVADAGAEPRVADLDDLAALAAAAREADAVIHLANKHDWANPAESNRAERAAVQTFVDALAGSGRALLFASGIAGLTPGRAATEADANPAHGPDSMRGGAENLALEAADRGLVPVALRFAPSVHGAGDWGFVRTLADAARRTGVSGYVGDGGHAWSATHRSDVAELIVRVLADPTRAEGVVHAVAEPRVPTRRIAEALAERYGLPVASIESERAVEHFGFIGRFFALDLSATAERTRERYDWMPSGPSLLDDIAGGAYDA